MPVPDSSESTPLEPDRYNTKHGTAGTSTNFHSRAGHFREFGTTLIPVPDALVISVHQYISLAWYDIHTGIEIFGKFPHDMDAAAGFHSETGHFGEYNISTGTVHFGMFGTTSIPVPDVSVTYRTLRGIVQCRPTNTRFRSFNRNDMFKTEYYGMFDAPPYQPNLYALHASIACNPTFGTDFRQQQRRRQQQLSSISGVGGGCSGAACCCCCLFFLLLPRMLHFFIG